MSGLDELDPRLRGPLEQMIAASGGKIWLGEGLRTVAQQEALFRSRHYVDPNGEISWNGQRWTKSPGVASAAPPGRSMHEIGLAADIQGDMAWLQANVGKYGLLTFADVNDEPWHVQLVELPKSRAEYDKKYPNGAAGQPGVPTDPALPTWDGEAGTGPFDLPSDAKLYNTGAGIIAVFDVGGVKIGYDVDLNAGNVKVDPSTVLYGHPSQVVNAGSIEELRGLPYGTYKEFFDAVIGKVLGFNNPARNDPEILKVLAEFAGRPDMTAAELESLLHATSWYQSRATTELEWNNLSEAERVKRKDELAAQMAQTWYQYTGEQVSVTDPRVLNYVEQVASGKIGFGSWTETVVKPRALMNPESPWSRDVRNEGETQKQRGVDIENTAQRIKDLSRRWGVQWSEPLYQEWARKITTSEASEADVLGALQQQAKILYPWKDDQVETLSAAQPWIETYKRVFEKDGTIFSPQIQAALSAGAPVWEFEQELKKTPEWLETKNGREDMFSTMSEINRLMGYS